MNIPRHPDTNVAAYHTLCCEAIIDCLMLARLLSKGTEVYPRGHLLTEATRDETDPIPFLIGCARGIQGDAGMSDMEYDALLAASAF